MSLKGLNPELQKYIKQGDVWFEYHVGNIIDYPDIDMIIHQANCFHLMNAGVAYTLHETYPDVFLVDTKTGRGDRNKLGGFSTTMVTHKVTGKNLIICNLYSQYHPGSSSFVDDADIDSAKSRFNFLNESLNHLIEYIKLFSLENPNAEMPVLRVGVPWMIGCGIAGGNTEKVFCLFQSLFAPIAKQVKIIFIDITGDKNA